MPDTAMMRFTPTDIDESAGIPLYQQIYNLLRARIMDGTMPGATATRHRHCGHL